MHGSQSALQFRKYADVMVALIKVLDVEGAAEETGIIKRVFSHTMTRSTATQARSPHAFPRTTCDKRKDNKDLLTINPVGHHPFDVVAIEIQF